MRNQRRGLTLLESLITLFLVSLVLTCVGHLLTQSFRVMRSLDEKERSRQAARMGLDRLTSEVREATAIISAGAGDLSFEKIDPQAVINPPPLAPNDPDPNYVPPAWTPQDAYPDTARLVVQYETQGETLVRRVRRKSGGAWTTQVVVEGVNSFSCLQEADNAGELTVTVAVVDGQQIKTQTSRILCPCVREPFS